MTRTALPPSWWLPWLSQGPGTAKAKKKVHWHHFWLPNGATSIHFGFVGWNSWRNSWTAEQLVAICLATWRRHILRRIHHDIGVFAVRAISEGFQNQPRLAGTPTMASYRSSLVLYSLSRKRLEGWQWSVFLSVSYYARIVSPWPAANPTEFRPHLAAFRILLELLHLVSTGMDRNHMGLRSGTVSGSYGGWFLPTDDDDIIYLLEVPECPHFKIPS